MTSTLTPEQIADKLTEAQRRYLTVNAKHDFVWGEKRWMTYPPPNTHRVLHKLGLVLAVGMITEFGLPVRKVLQDRQQGGGHD